MSDKVLAVLTEIIIRNINENKKLPWHRPWFGAARYAKNGTDINAPRNIVTNRAYRGINYMLTSLAGFPSPFWMTFDQARAKKLYLKPGQHYTPIVKWIIDEDEPGKMVFKGCRYFQAYNLSQFKDWETVKTPDAELEIVEPEVNENKFIESAEEIVKNYKNVPEINYNGNKACYIPSIDLVKVPAIESFVSSEAYYATLIHELVHSTGHENRLKRKGVAEGMDGFGGKNYSFEELVAEIGSCFLCNKIGIDSEKVFENSVAYIQGWLEKFNNDVKMLPMAAQMAQKAVDYILGNEYKKVVDGAE